ncbi:MULTISPECIES: hypothetical protein [unclassified Caballeronia]|uniref:hypothetical protein n=1 Tax=unclassified Caballeronia TaxID=2646786 RepID=UPI0028547B08|nr:MULTISPECIES: hypothetical protein [unclassified Caballeronia]MDR5740783.1 hypothetical protein [Caballeronia sp. LZ016]MDR5808696.1 hypothetical protein [Caballeronia sp. LZ019]
MSDTQSTRQIDPCRLGVAFIDAQLLSLCTHAGLLADWIENGEHAPDFSALARLVAHRRAHPEAHAHSEDGMPMKQEPTDDLQPWPSLATASERMAFALRVPCVNAILAVADFFDVHRLSSSRTPEVQFLMRLRDAAVNGERFRIGEDEYVPHAAYGGLIIDKTLDGQALFGQTADTGFIAFGDVVGLLAYLRKLLKSMQAVISSGDAG